MDTFKKHIIITTDGTVVVDGLPFHKGDEVEVIVNSSPVKESANGHYPLRGTPYRYADPFEPVAHSDWNVTDDRT